MNTDRCKRSPRRDQHGATLIVLLIMLMVITLLALSTIRSTTLDEKMAGNARDRDKAFQAAEAAVQSCLNQVNGGTYAAAKVLTPAEAGQTPNWEQNDLWDSSGTTVDVGDTTLSAQPKCLVENLGSGSYRVTGRAQGGSDTSLVVLQATYSTE